MNNKKIMLFLCYISFGFIGFILSMRSNVFLFVQRDYLDGYSHIATLVLISGIFMQVSLFFSGYLITRFGFKKILLIGVSGFMIPVVLMIFVNSALTFDIIFICLMFGYGIAVLVLNLFVSSLEPERKGNVLLMLHLYFAVGAFLGPKWISSFVDSGYPWQKVIALSAIPLLIISLIIYRINKGIRLPGEDTKQLSKQAELPLYDKSNQFSLYKNPLVWFFIIAFMCSQTWEYGIGTWFVLFANETRGLTSSEAAFYLTVFYGSYPLVRILFSKIIHRLNLLTVVFYSFLISGIFIGLGILTGNFLFYSFTGLGVALMYPSLMAVMQDIFGEKSTKIIGFISMVGGLIQYLAIWGVGLISDQWGIYRGFTSMIVYMILGCLSILGIVLTQKKERIPNLM